MGVSIEGSDFMSSSVDFQACDDIIILHLTYLAYPHYVITVHIYGLHSVVLDAIVFKVCFSHISNFHIYALQL